MHANLPEIHVVAVNSQSDDGVWHTSTFWTRHAPDGRILKILERWHEDDLAGITMPASSAGADCGRFA